MSDKKLLEEQTEHHKTLKPELIPKIFNNRLYTVVAGYLMSPKELMDYRGILVLNKLLIVTVLTAIWYNNVIKVRNIDKKIKRSFVAVINTKNEIVRRVIAVTGIVLPLEPITRNIWIGLFNYDANIVTMSILDRNNWVKLINGYIKEIKTKSYPRSERTRTTEEVAELKTMVDNFTITMKGIKTDL